MERREYASADNVALDATVDDAAQLPAAGLSLVPLPEKTEAAPKAASEPAQADMRPLPVPLPESRSALWLVVLSTTLALAWIAVAGAYVWGRYGVDFITLPLSNIATSIGITLLPALGVLFVGLFLTYVRDTQRSAELLANAAFHLVAPIATTDSALSSLGARLRAEIDRMDSAMNDALTRARDLEKVVSSEVEALSRAGGTAANYTSGLKKTLEAERHRLDATGQRLSTQAEKLSYQLDERVEKLGKAADKTEKLTQEAALLIEKRLGELRGAGEKSAAEARNAGEDVRQAAERLEKAAGSALSAARQSRELHDTETVALNESANRVGMMGQALRDTLKTERERIETLVNNLRTESELITGLAATASHTLSESFLSTANNAQTLTENARKYSALVGESARTAILEVEEALDKLLQASDTTASVLQSSIKRLNDSLGGASMDMRVRADEFTGISTRLGEAAHKAGHEVGDTAHRLLNELSRFPGETAQAAAAIRGVFEEQINALAAIADAAARQGNLFDVSLPRRGSQESTAPADEPVLGGLARRLKRKFVSREEVTEGAENWRMRDVLNKAEKIDAPNTPIAVSSPALAQDDARIMRGALETLEAMSADLCMALEDNGPVDLWARFEKGEGDIFLTRLLKLPADEFMAQFNNKARKDANIRSLAERYVERFEKLLATVAQGDRTQIMRRTYVSADTGRLYMALSAALGRRV